MKNYNPTIEAQNIVRANTRHGESRRTNEGSSRQFVTSVLTEKAHTRALTGCAIWAHARFDGKRLKNLTPGQAQQYLLHRAEVCRQSTVNLDRQSLNFHLFPDSPLAFVQSKTPTVARDRAYSASQVQLLTDHARPELAYSIQLCVDSGLRGMELISIAELTQVSPSDRIWDSSRFTGREDDRRFVVHGKGGLRREVRLKPEIAMKLTEKARPSPIRSDHRGGHLTSYFNLLGGHRFSIDFGKLSKTVLGFSLGSHGLRHAFAQRRRDELLCCGFSVEHSIQILSQELGHFSIKNTLAYLRDMTLQNATFDKSADAHE